MDRGGHFIDILASGTLRPHGMEVNLGVWDTDMRRDVEHQRAAFMHPDSKWARAITRSVPRGHALHQQRAGWLSGRTLLNADHSTRQLLQLRDPINDAKFHVITQLDL